jgi:hypothetical protein
MAFRLNRLSGSFVTARWIVNVFHRLTMLQLCNVYVKIWQSSFLRLSSPATFSYDSSSLLICPLVILPSSEHASGHGDLEEGSEQSLLAVALWDRRKMYTLPSSNAINVAPRMTCRRPKVGRFNTREARINNLPMMTALTLVHPTCSPLSQWRRKDVRSSRPTTQATSLPRTCRPPGRNRAWAASM